VKLLDRIRQRPPDFIIGGQADPYLERWFVIPRNRLFNIYLHRFLRDDDDRALHDHPWSNCSILLEGEYTEHTIEPGGIPRRAVLRKSAWRFRLSGRFAHRVELHAGECWTLFITGPRYREWGFHCPERGWVPWQEFTDPADSGTAGKGCD